MRVLVAAPHDPVNPYCRELGAGYRAAGCEVVYGPDLFLTGHAPVDLVHVQWPEHLVPAVGTAAPRVEVVVERLEAWRERAIVVATIHNSRPHVPFEGWRALYGAVYERCDGIIHHGRRSLEWFASAFPEQVGKPHITVPHGGFTTYPSTVTREEARSRLGLGPDERVLLVFGRTRTVQELALVARGVRTARVPRKKLLMSRSFPVRRLASLRNRLLRARYLAAVPHTLLQGFLPPEELQYPFRAADLMVLQRLEGLNSSNLMLAFSFGLPVVSPDVGVFGELAGDLDNVVFSPVTPGALAAALERAFTLDLRAIGRRNREVALGEWSWGGGARRMLDFVATLRTRAAEPAG